MFHLWNGWKWHFSRKLKIFKQCQLYRSGCASPWQPLDTRYCACDCLSRIRKNSHHSARFTFISSLSASRFMHVQFVQDLVYERTKAQKFKVEILKIYRALYAFYKTTIIPLVRWSFIRARFRLNSANLIVPLTINRTEVLTRISVPEMSLEQLVSQEPTECSASGRGQFNGEREFRIWSNSRWVWRHILTKWVVLVFDVATEITKNHSKMKRDRRVNSAILTNYVFTRFQSCFKYIAFPLSYIFSANFHLHTRLQFRGTSECNLSEPPLKQGQLAMVCPFLSNHWYTPPVVAGLARTKRGAQ
jgi:hypothetical protein